MSPLILNRRAKREYEIIETNIIKNINFTDKILFIMVNFFYGGQCELR